MTNVQVFFTTRSSARAAGFGKMTDNGANAEKRWGRTIEVNVAEKKQEITLTRTGRRGSNVTTTVITKKRKEMVMN